MNENEKKYLKYAFDSYLKTGNPICNFLPKNGVELTITINAVKSLHDMNYVIALSDNFESDTLNMLKNTTLQSDMVFCYQITDAGIAYAKSIFKEM